MIVKKAEKFCQDQGHRLTPPRHAVIDIVAKTEKPLGAYDILEALRAYIDNPKPPTAYRAIEFWQQHGFIHRIESLNAYVTCSAGHKHQGSQYMICDSCGDAKEIHMCSMPVKLKEKAQSEGFTPRYWNTEIHGQCDQCAEA